MSAKDSASKGSAKDSAKVPPPKFSAEQGKANAKATDTAPDPRHRLVLGPRFDGSDAYDYFRPSLITFASALAVVEAAPPTATVKWETCVPLPAGMWLHRRASDNMPLLSMADYHTARFRRVFGFVGEIKLIKDEPTDVIGFHSPAMLTLVTKIWWRYGTLKAEAHDSWVWCRLLTFESPCGFSYITSRGFNTWPLQARPSSTAKWKLFPSATPSPALWKLLLAACLRPNFPAGRKFRPQNGSCCPPAPSWTTASMVVWS